MSRPIRRETSIWLSRTRRRGRGTHGAHASHSGYTGVWTWARRSDRGNGSGSRIGGLCSGERLLVITQLSEIIPQWALSRRCSGAHRQGQRSAEASRPYRRPSARARRSVYPGACGLAADLGFKRPFRAARLPKRDVLRAPGITRASCELDQRDRNRTAGCRREAGCGATGRSPTRRLRRRASSGGSEPELVRDCRFGLGRLRGDELR